VTGVQAGSILFFAGWVVETGCLWHRMTHRHSAVRTPITPQRVPPGFWPAESSGGYRPRGRS
jgi:hypothetical protein